MQKNKKVVIRDDADAHMRWLRNWLDEARNIPFEEMSDFFTARIGEYEQKMSFWDEAYTLLPSFLPATVVDILDLGCGTGLELDTLLRERPDLRVTGVDICGAMLEKLKEKHPDVRIIQADYFECDFGESRFDGVISFESLHHFKPAKKLELFEKIYHALRPGGIFINTDYIACSDEEENLLMEFYDQKRAREGIPDNIFVHFDIPLTAEHETELLYKVGFKSAELVSSIKGASTIVAVKK